MDNSSDEPILQIKKYPNRRYYDATQSRHLTLQDVYALVRGGQEVRIQNSRTGEDITNVILLQLLTEHDAEKLSSLPSSLLHQAMRCAQPDFDLWLKRLLAVVSELPMPPAASESPAVSPVLPIEPQD